MAPAGMAWTSDSGLFLSTPVDEPAPAPALTLLAGLAAIALLVRRQRA